MRPPVEFMFIIMPMLDDVDVVPIMEFMDCLAGLVEDEGIRESNADKSGLGCCDCC